MSLSQDELEDTLFLDIKQIRDRQLDIADYAALLRLCGVMKKSLPDAEQRGSFLYLSFAAKLQRAEKLWYIESQKTGLPYIDKGFFRMYWTRRGRLRPSRSLALKRRSSPPSRGRISSMSSMISSTARASASRSSTTRSS